MAELEKEIEQELQQRSEEFSQELAEQRAHVEEEVRAAQARLQAGLRTWLKESELRNVLSAPFIYAMAIPIALLDLSFTIYQAICFRLYRIPQVSRSAYVVIDRHLLPNLNPIEKLNCAYCGYANGVLAYTTEIAAQTEQYWCPIKHAKRALGSHHRYARFSEYASSGSFHDATDELRSELIEASDTLKSTIDPRMENA